MSLLSLQRDFFTSTGSVDLNGAVPEPVARAWSRLRQQGHLAREHFVHPDEPAPAAMPAEVIRLVRKIGPRFRLLGDEPDQTIALLVDAQGTLAAFDGGELIMRALASSGWRSGMSFREEFAGANAVDIALRDREPAHTVGAHHTVLALHDKAIHAQPLLTAGGEVLGALALITTAGANTRNAAAATSLAASLLETTLLSEGAAAELTRRLAEQRAIADAMSDGTMVINRNGIVEYMNVPAGRILRIDPERAVGSRLADMLGFEPVISPIFESGTGYSDEEVRIKRDGYAIHLIDTATPITDRAGRVASVVNTFREFGRVAQVAKKFGGNEARYSFDSVIGRSPALLDAVETARRAARGQSNVLITGESGTGKELFAQGIHLESPRAGGPFVAINCAALPLDLIESELFGYVSGSFTGASRSGRPGKFELASTGTIFLDEISEMPLDVQAKLLRVLQEREITRIGSSDPTPIDVRLVAAMNRNARSLVRDGLFREDLFYRINVIEIAIPALRERAGDVRILAEHYLQHYAALLDKPAREVIEPVMRRLERHDWPGNVRELQNTVERMVHFSDSEIIGEGLELPQGTRAEGRGLDATPDAPGTGIRTLAEVEREVIVAALGKTGHNVTRAAQILAVTKPRLYRLIDRHGITLQRARRKVD
ncbi:MAG: sigma 54-interacting transcriptional regulator [Caulobacterales bacterium]|nr:sigma 54-interacting transcriptional regulator [Caulobacterales bacterium]